MLRLFLTVSVLFWNQLAAQPQICHQPGCIVPDKIIQHETYFEFKFQSIRWVDTEVDSMDASMTGLEILSKYSNFANDAGARVPFIEPWGFAGKLDSGGILSKFRVYNIIAPEVYNPPKPTYQEVDLRSIHDSWYFVRAFEELVGVERYPEIMNKFMADLEADNQHFERGYFNIAFYSTYSPLTISFLKIGN